MPFAPGASRPPGSGRKKGQKIWKSARQILQDMNCDPIAGLVAIATEKNDTGAFVNEPQVRKSAYAELAQYVHPKLRAIEHTGAGGGAIEIELMTDDPKEFLSSRITELTARANPPSGDPKPEPETS
jgi:hypothetical protein